MVKRRAVGATVASAVIFSALIASNLVVYNAALQRERLADQADSENIVAVSASALAAAGALSLLDQTQQALGSQAFPCGSADRALGSALGVITASETSGGVTVTGSVSPSTAASAIDNLTTLRPFNGTLTGWLGLSVLLQEKGGSNPTGVSLAKNESHLLHLPVHWALIGSFCEQATLSVESSLQNQTVSDCSDAGVSAAVENATAAPKSEALGLGLTAAFTYASTPASGGTCRVDFDLLVSQTSVDGPEGPFSVRMEAEGSAYVQTSPAPPG